MEQKISDFKIINTITKNVNNKDWECLFSDCSNSSINSHFLQQNGVLDIIADNGHIYELKKNNLFQMEKKGEFGFYKIGVNKGFSLPLFCKEHDCSIFKPIETENHSFNNYKTQLLFSYRACCNEIRRKQRIFEINNRIINSNRLQNRFVKEITASQNNGLKLGIQDLHYFRKYFENDLVDLNSSKSFTFYTYTLPKFDLCVSGTFSPIDLSDLSKNYMEQEEPLDTIFLNLIPTENNLKMIIGYHNNHVNQWIENYVNSWHITNDSEVMKMLTELLSTRMNSWCLSPRLYSQFSQQTINKFLNYWNNNYMNIDYDQHTDFNLFENNNGS